MMNAPSPTPGLHFCKELTKQKNIMKNLRLIALLAVISTCFSCSKDDNETDVNSSVLGEWQLEEISYSGTTSVNADGFTSIVSYSAEAIDIDAQVIFNDATNYTTKGSYVIRMTTTFDGDTEVENYPFTNINGSGTYRIEGNKIFTEPNLPPGSEQEYLMGSGEGTILELTENRMVLFVAEQVNSTVENMEMEVTYEVTQILTR